MTESGAGERDARAKAEERDAMVLDSKKLRALDRGPLLDDASLRARGLARVEIDPRLRDERLEKGEPLGAGVALGGGDLAPVR